jgi:cbb3-type cytochrome oxidase subunit 1
MAGVLLLALPLAAAGVSQGLRLADPQAAFMDSAKAALMFLRLSTVGETLLLLGNGLFLLNILALTLRYLRSLAREFRARAAAPALPVEVTP